MSRAEWVGFVAAVFTTAWVVGVFNRFAFEDEIFTLNTLERFDLAEVFANSTSGWESHGPLSNVLYELIDYVASPSFMRAFALLLSCVAFGMVLDLTLRALDELPRGGRLIVAGAFVSFPLLYGAGDALRSYPLTAFLVALFVWIYLRREELDWRAGIPLGLAASTTVTPIVPYAAFLVHRYLIKRCLNIRDVWMHLVLLATALPALVNLVRFHDQGDTLSVTNPLDNLGNLGLGLLGGMRVGLSRSPLLLPLAAAVIWAGWVAWNNRHRFDRLRRAIVEYSLLLVLLSGVFSTLSGRGAARTYLFLAPFVVALLVIGVASTSHQKPRATVLAALAVMLAFGTFAANYHLSSAPLRRNLAIPYTEVIDFVVVNSQGATLLVSGDAVASRGGADAGLCTIGRRHWTERQEASPFYVSPLPDCYRGSVTNYETVVVVENSAFWDSEELVTALRDAESALPLVSVAHFGEDRDAGLKNRLRTTKVSDWMLEVSIFRN